MDQRKGIARGVEDRYWLKSVTVRISEAKNLPAKDLNGFSDPYCVIQVDDEYVARTSTIWKELNPFFGEEFVLAMSNDFQQLDVLLFDQDRLSKDDAIGSVRFARKQLEQDAKLGLDTWYPIVRSAREATTYGEVFVELMLSETATGLDELTVTILRARDLLTRTTASKCDPFVVVQLDEERCQTLKCKTTKYPVWEEHFVFERAKLGPSLTLQVRDANAFKGSAFMGEALLDLSRLEKDVPSGEWHRLCPRAKDIAGLTEGSGSIRISLKYTSELILPLSTYRPLTQALVASVQSQDQIRTGVVTLLEDVLADRDQSLSDRESVARTLVRVLLAQNHCVTFLQNLNGSEISKSSEAATLFRGNSMATKCSDQYMKIVGLQYLHHTLKPIIDEVFREKQDCEIDPSKINSAKPEDTIAKNAQILTTYLEKILAVIFESPENCPHGMRLVFKALQESVKQNLELDAVENTQYTVVSGFLFLRFFAPAVLSPKLFGMREELADARTSRTLTLLAKALQSVGNLGSNIGSGKEAYMEPLVPIIKQNLERVKTFIQALCAVSSMPKDTMVQGSKEDDLGDSVLAVGTIQFRTDTGGAFKGFKKRCFAVSASSLTHEKSRDPSTRVVIPLSTVTAVEQTDISVFDRKHCITIHFKTGDPMFLVLPTQLDFHVWLQALRKACRFAGASLAASVHPGVFRQGKWTCCKFKFPAQFPCAKAHSTVAVNQFADNAGPSVWAHRLFAMLLQAKPGLQQQYGSASGGVKPGLSDADLQKQPACLAMMQHVDDINLQHLLQQDMPLY